MVAIVSVGDNLVTAMRPDQALSKAKTATALTAMVDGLALVANATHQRGNLTCSQLYVPSWHMHRRVRHGVDIEFTTHKHQSRQGSAGSPLLAV